MFVSSLVFNILQNEILAFFCIIWYMYLTVTLTLYVFISIEGSDLLDLFEWLTKVWFHLNEILEEFCEPDSTIGE